MSTETSVEQQRIYLSLALSSRELLTKISPIIDPSYFDATLRKTVSFIQNYFKEYKEPPRADVVRAETGVTLESYEGIGRGEVAFVSSEVESFCQHRAVENVLRNSPQLLEKGDFSNIITQLKTAISVSLDQGGGTDYFVDPEARLESLLETHARYSTGIPELDEYIGGGLARQELLLFAANSGGGKSMNMLNIGYNLLQQGLNGVYISLEMGEHVVGKRLDSMITGISQENILKQMQQVAAIIRQKSDKMGKFKIKRMPENRTNINHIRAYLEEEEQKSGFIPDFIIVDYVDILGTTMSVSMDNLFVKDKYVCEEVRSLGHDFDVIMISASQLGRGALEADELHQGMIQGGISKINTTDVAIAIKQTPQMKAAGEVVYQLLKTRNSDGVGKTLTLGWNATSLRVESLRGGKKGSDLKIPQRKPATQLTSSSTIFAKLNSGGEQGAEAPQAEQPSTSILDLADSILSSSD